MSTPGVSHPSPTTAEDFRRVLDERAVQPVFQPVVDLDNRHVLGYEALARGPMGSALETPAAMFGAAWRAGRVAELDWACRAAAFTGAVRGGLGPALTLFVNAEPVSLGVACPDDLNEVIEPGKTGLRVVVEVTERAVAGDPALDDVGAAPASLAVLPFVRPDLIKLDMRLLRGRTTAEAAHIVNSVRAHAERTDAVVLAEGIETIKHAREAVAAGATLGQGSCSATRARCPRRCRRPARPFRCARPRRPAPPPPPGRWWRPPGSRAWPPRICWSRCACSWSTRAGRVRAQRAAGLLPGGRPVHRGRPQPLRVPGHPGGVHRRPRPQYAGGPGRRGPRRRPRP